MSITPQPPQEPEPDPTVVIALNRMRLRARELRAAVLAGADAAARVTDNDVRTLAGFLKWATPLRYLGDIYVPQGFTRMRPGGFEVLRSPDDAFELTVAQGTYATGIRERMPTTRIDRGPLTAQAVDFNRGQLRLDSNVIPFGPLEVRPDEPPACLTWLLLSYHDALANEIRVELSVPVEFARKNGTDAERGTVTRFDPRLILPPIPLRPDTPIEHDDDDDEGEEGIDISVDRRR